MKKQLLQKAINYIELIEDAKRLIKIHQETIKRYKLGHSISFIKHYEERIRVNNRIIARLERRVNTLILKSLENE